MKFFILSDLHLKTDFNDSKAKEYLKYLCQKIRKEIPIFEHIVFVSLGDIIDAGKTGYFDTAGDCFTFISSELYEYTVDFNFVPGNHDAENGDIRVFDNFISGFGVKHRFENNGVYSKVYDGINFIFADSIRHRIHNHPGELDYEAIRDNVKAGKLNLLFCHHGFTQSYGGSHDTVSEGFANLNRLHGMSIDFVFHGHTHRAEAGTLGEKVVEIGCGSFSSHEDWMEKDGILNQFTVGSTRDGNLYEVTRYVLSLDSSEIFTYSPLYPASRTFSVPDMKDKMKYECIPYIPRKLFIHSFYLEDSFTQSFYLDKACSLYEALIRKQQVLMLSDAGMGKTMELKHLAHWLYNTSLFPFLYDLRYYSGEKIEDLLPVTYNQLVPHRKVLLFDGYDELPPNGKRAFEIRINSYVKEAPQTFVVISSRRNFCKIDEANKSTIFPAFTAYDLCSLYQCDIEAFIESEGIDKIDFLREVGKSSIKDLLKNPFYLVGIAKLYKSKSILPKKAELMRELIKESFSSDENKYTHELEDRHRELYKLLCKLAFSMQLMGKVGLDDYWEYQELIERKSDRDLIKHCSLLQNVDGLWTFYHSNFREYLAAEYLSTLSEEKVKAYIAHEDGIKPRWANTLGFLTSLDLNWDQIRWLADFCPEALVKCEQDRVSSELKYDVFKSIFLNHEQDGLWFENEFCTEAELAFFAATNDALSFILNRIENPVHTQSQHTAINVLRHFPYGLYGRRDEVRECLYKLCRSFPDNAGHTCRIAIAAIAELKLNTPELTNSLVTTFSSCDNDFIRLGLYEYLIDIGAQDKYVDFFLSGLKYIDDTFGDSKRVFDEQYWLEQGLKTMSTVESITSILRWCWSENSDDHISTKIVSSILNTATKLYSDRNTQLFDEVFNCFIKTYHRNDFEYSKLFVAFFEKTKTFESAALLAADNISKYTQCLSYMIIVNPETMALILDAYKNGRYNNHDIFIKIADTYASDSIYPDCVDAVRKRTGISMAARSPRIDYGALAVTGQQEYFDSLFSKDAFSNLLSLLVQKTEQADIKIGELFEFHPNIAEHHSSWNILRIAIYNYADPVWPVSEFLERVNFGRFSLVQISKKIKSNKKLVITHAQATQIENAVINCLESGVLKNEIHCYNNYSIPSDFGSALITLASHFNCELSENVFLDMTEFPGQCFSENGDVIRKCEYLLTHISEDKLKSRLSENLRSKKIGQNILLDHIQMCLNYNYDIAADEAIAICTLPCDNTWLRNVALKYLYSLYGVEYIEHAILPSANADFLLEISSVCKDISQSKLRSAMEKEYIKAPSLALLEALISRDSIMALEEYVSKVECDYHPPEYPNENGSEPTRTIRDVSEIDRLPYIERLIIVVFSPEFRDNSVFSLKSSLRDALINCGEKAPEAVIEMLERHNDNTRSSDWNYFFAYVSKEIRRKRKNLRDKPLSLAEVKNLLF